LVNAASVYFVDVGQGAATIIAFDDGNLVIVDCGPSATPLLDILEGLDFDRITAVVLSHWHKDHVGGAPRLVGDYIDRIDGVYFARERPATLILSQIVLNELRELSSNESKFWLDHLRLQGNLQGRLYPQEPGHGCQAKVLYPTLLESMESEVQPDPNQGSGIISISAGNHRILIPGDAGRQAFEALLKRTDARPIQCDITSAPHHSGKLEKDARVVPGFANIFEWFYQKAVDTKHVIVSAGTGNDYGHPRRNHLHAARRSGATVQCTELTKECATETLIDALNQGTCCVDKTSTYHGRHRLRSNASVGCAGTIRVDLTNEHLLIHRLHEHQTSIDVTLDPNLAQCRCPLTVI